MKSIVEEHIRLGVLASVIVPLVTWADVVKEPLYDFTNPGVVIGEKVTGLGVDGKEVALVFTNTVATAENPFVYPLPAGVRKVRYLVVGGGGSGGCPANAYGGGGGGAGMVNQTAEGAWYEIPAGADTVFAVVGQGGASVSGSSGQKGGNSSLRLANADQSVVCDVISYGGGGGGGSNANAPYSGGDIGGGGGGGSGTSGQGRKSGAVGQSSTGGIGYNYNGGGGGGAGGDGQNSGLNDGGTGQGGAGVATTIFDDTEYRIAGGGSGSSVKRGENNTSTDGGGMGGYRSANTGKTATSATRWGAGGGGTRGNQDLNSGAGYQGVVVIRYALAAQLAELPEIASVVYNGEAQVADVADGEGYTVTANAGGVEAGDYTVTLTLKEGYVWVDNSSEPKNLTFTITQAANVWTGEPALSKTEWNVGEDAAEVTAPTTQFGTVTVTLARNGEEAVAFDGTMPTEAGHYDLTFTAPETCASYAAPDPAAKTISFDIISNAAIVRDAQGGMYDSFEAAFAAVPAGSVLTVVGEPVVATAIPVTKDLTLVLNGHAITMAEGKKTTFQIIDGATLTIDGTVEGSSITGNLYLGVKTDNNGHLVINGGTYTCSVADDAVVQSNGTCTDCTLIATGATFNSTDDTFYLAAGGSYTLTDCVINGATGLYVKGGALVMTRCTVNATGAAADPVPNGNGASSTGDAIIVDAKAGYTGHVSLALTDCTVASANGHALRETYTDLTTTAVHAIAITGGTYRAAEGKTAFATSEAFDAALEAGASTCTMAGAAFSTPVAAQYTEGGRGTAIGPSGLYEVCPEVDTENVTYTWQSETPGLWSTVANWAKSIDFCAGVPKHAEYALAVFPATSVAEADAEPIAVTLTEDTSVKGLEVWGKRPVEIDLADQTLSLGERYTGADQQIYHSAEFRQAADITFKNGALTAAGSLWFNTDNVRLTLDGVRASLSSDDHAFMTVVNKRTSTGLKNGWKVHLKNGSVVTGFFGIRPAGGEPEVVVEGAGSSYSGKAVCLSGSGTLLLAARDGGTFSLGGGWWVLSTSGLTSQAQGAGSSFTIDMPTGTAYPHNVNASNCRWQALDGATFTFNQAPTDCFNAGTGNTDKGNAFVVRDATFKMSGSFRFGTKETDEECVSPTLSFQGSSPVFQTGGDTVFGSSAVLIYPPVLELVPSATGFTGACLTSTSAAAKTTIGDNVTSRVVVDQLEATRATKVVLDVARAAAITVDCQKLAAQTSFVLADGKRAGGYSVTWEVKSAADGEHLLATVRKCGLTVIIR